MVATHDLNLAAERFDRLMLINQKIIGFGQAHDVFTADLLSQAYSGSMRLIETGHGTMFISDSHCCGGEEHAPDWYSRLGFWVIKNSTLQM